MGRTEGEHCMSAQKMLFQDLTIEELTDILRNYSGCRPAPYLTDPAVREQAVRLAVQNGVWEQIDREFNPGGDIPVIKRSEYRDYRRTGNRNISSRLKGLRGKEFSLAAMALWLDHPKADLDYLQDLMWAYCEETNWVLAAHEDKGSELDLASLAIGARLAETAHIFSDRIEEEVKNRVHGEIDRRIFRNYTRYDHDFRDLPEGNSFFWKTTRHNWNHVCNCNVIKAALYTIERPDWQANIIHQAVQHMSYALQGFEKDGGCLEGPGYWGYGFGHYVQAAELLFSKTKGEINLMKHDPIIESICRYPLAACIEGQFRTTFGDGGHGYVSARTAILINRFFDMPELFDLCKKNDDGSVSIKSMYELALYEPEKKCRPKPIEDVFLPSLGQVVLRGEGESPVVLAAKAGHNDAPHNHNDVGSFMVYRDGLMYITDPGSPRYTKRTFDENRYSINYCNSYGHSVPLINGCMQAVGENHNGKISVDGLNGSGEKEARIELAGAYPEGTVEELVRTLRLNSRQSSIKMRDSFVFAQEPENLQEPFITFEETEVASDGRSVTVGPPGKTLQITAGEGTEGVFELLILDKETERDRKKNAPIIRRITFHAANLKCETALEFTLRFDW